RSRTDGGDGLGGQAQGVLVLAVTVDDEETVDTERHDAADHRGEVSEEHLRVHRDAGPMSGREARHETVVDGGEDEAVARVSQAPSEAGCEGAVGAERRMGAVELDTADRQDGERGCREPVLVRAGKLQYV